MAKKRLKTSHLDANQRYCRDGLLHQPEGVTAALAVGGGGGAGQEGGGPLTGKAGRAGVVGRMSTALEVALLVTTVAIPLADGHGHLTLPPSRNGGTLAKAADCL